MKRILLPLLFLLTGVLVHVVFAEDSSQPNWLIQVQSVFVDEMTKKAVKITGSGFLARIGNQFVVVCDSHLSQGPAGLLLKSASATLKPKSELRLADNDHDIEIIAIEDPGINEYFTFDGKSFRMDRRVFLKSVASSTVVQMSKTGVIPVAPWSRSRPRPIQKNDGALPSAASMLAEQPFRRLDGELTERWDKGELISESLVSAGMSGEPILNSSDEDVTVAGIAKAYHRYWTRSFFSTPEQLAALTRAFVAGKTGATSQTKWRYRGFTYRDFGDGTLEINPIQTQPTEILPSGGGDSADGGGGDSADGGGGDSADGGGGDSADGGGVSDQPRHASLSLLSISPGMQWKGQSILAFKARIPNLAKRVQPFVSYVDDGETKYVRPKRLKDQNSDTKEVFVYASKANREVLPALGVDPSKIQSIGEDVNFYDLFHDRVSSVFYFRHYDSPTECYIDSSAPKGTVRIRLPQALDPTRRYITSKPWIIEIDSKGIVKGTGAKQFEPFLVLKDPRLHVPVIIDIRGLFFADFTRVTERNMIRYPLITPHLVMKVGESKEWMFICNQTDNTSIFKKGECFFKPNCQTESMQKHRGGWLEAISGALRKLFK